MQRATLRHEKATPEEAGRIAVRPGRVLFAEGHAELRRRLAEALGRSGYEVLPAADAQAALSLLATLMLRHEAPDLVIVDARLPVGGAMAVLDAVRELDWETPVILLLPSRNRSSIGEALRQGASAVFPADEPFAVGDLCAFACGVAPPG